jgi:hypothetical protein
VVRSSAASDVYKRQLYGRPPQDKKITYTDEFKNLVKGVDLHLGDEPKKPLIRKPTKNKII